MKRVSLPLLGILLYFVVGLAGLVKADDLRLRESLRCPRDKTPHSAEHNVKDGL